MGSSVLRKRWYILACVLCFSCFCNIWKVKGSITVEGTIVIDGKKPISETDEHFICATMDWWPSDLCNNGSCSWGNASLLNLDLTNNILLNAVKAFSPLRIRLGGTLQDRVIYQTEDHRIPCVPFKRNLSELIFYTEGCLPLARWDELNSFFNKSGAVITFGLNALNGKVILPNSTATGPWNPKNAASLIRYTVKKGYKVYGWELGNELGGKPVAVGVPPVPYVSDTNTLRNLIQEIYQNISKKPRVIAPAGTFEQEWFQKYIAEARSVDVITHHIYNLGSSGTAEELIERILDPSFLESGAELFKNLSKIIKNTNTSAVAWVGEAGGISRSGRDRVSNVFVNGFWYLDQLGLSSKYNTKTYCRQSLIGGYYGLLNLTTFVPNPDYYSALLWHRLMGRSVLSTKFTGTRKIRAYSHCAKRSGGVTVLLLNLDGNTTIKAELNLNNTGTAREEYHLTPLEGNIQSHTVLLNGKALSVDSSGAIPSLKPVMVNSMEPIVVSPYSIVFVHVPNVAIAACKKY